MKTNYPLTIQQQKINIRQKFRAARQSITQVESLSAGESVASRLGKLTSYFKAQHIACFLSFDGEINTQPIIQSILMDNKVCLLPCLKPLPPNRLWFMPYESGDPLLPNRLGIKEVDKPVNLAHRISQIDIILMPLVAFDSAGARLGMGGGFYDVTLSHLSAHKTSRRPICIGVAFESQKFAELPVETWDYPLDGVLTEENYYEF